MIRDGDEMKLVLFLMMMFSESYVYSFNGICGTEDDRVQSNDMKVARARRHVDENPCTATLIGRSCMLTAHHCHHLVRNIEFNTPLSLQDTTMVPADSKHTYLADTESFEGGRSFINGNDWMVFRVLPHSDTGLYPGDVYGYYNVSFDDPGKLAEPIEFRITGYGEDDGSDSRTQQTATGGVYRFEYDKDIIRNKIDIRKGNSGSALIYEATQEIFGILTNSGCGKMPESSNKAVMIYNNTKLIEAIKSCVDSEMLID